MGEIIGTRPVKLFCGLLVNSVELFDKVEKILEEKFDNKIDKASDVVPFDYTTYYNHEMGDNILRKYIFFEKLISPTELVDIKILTNKIEEEFVNIETGNRIINIDPGYMNVSKVVLASTKDFKHRIYIGKGIFEEITLFYQKPDGFQAWEWSYADYKSPFGLKFFNSMRPIYRKQLELADGDKIF